MFLGGNEVRQRKVADIMSEETPILLAEPGGPVRVLRALREYVFYVISWGKFNYEKFRVSVINISTMIDC